MILYVDLKCSCCYKKVKKLLCKFPQIRDQIFDEDKNKVMITVVCCNPEKLRDKLCCKGGKAIESIEIVEKPPPPIPKRHEPQKLPPPPIPKQHEPQKLPPPPPVVDSKPPQPQSEPVKKHDPVPQPKPKPVFNRPIPDPIHQPFCPRVSVCCQECSEGRGGGPCHCPPVSVCCQECNEGRGGGPCHCPPVSVCCQECNKGRGGGPCHCPPISVCCQECYEGRGGGPCHYGYGRHIPPSRPCYNPNYGYQYRPCYVTRCDYFSEENPQGCSIM